MPPPTEVMQGSLDGCPQVQRAVSQAKNPEPGGFNTFIVNSDKPAPLGGTLPRLSRLLTVNKRQGAGSVVRVLHSHEEHEGMLRARHRLPLPIVSHSLGGLPQ